MDDGEKAQIKLIFEEGLKPLEKTVGDLRTETALVCQEVGQIKQNVSQWNDISDALVEDIAENRDWITTLRGRWKALSVAVGLVFTVAGLTVGILKLFF